MKKITLSILGLLAFGYASAQDDAAGGKGFANGDVFISGGVGISSETWDEDKYTTFTFAPKVGFFVTENIAVGVAIEYTGTTDDDGVNEVKSNTLGAGAFARYYASPASDFSFFAELGAMYQSTKQEMGGGDLKSNGFNIALSPGVSYFISNNFALEASIGVLSYETDKADFEGAEATNTFELGVGLSDISLGLVYKF